MISSLPSEEDISNYDISLSSYATDKVSFRY